VAAHQLAVGGEADVALHDAGAHAHRGLVGLLRVLGELQRRAAVADREVGFAERARGAFLQALLQLARPHGVHQVERPRPELHGAAFPIVVAIGEGCVCQQAQQRAEHGAPVSHRISPFG
jgi:hypothetical protein